MLKAEVLIDRDFAVGATDPRLFGAFVEHLDAVGKGHDDRVWQNCFRLFQIIPDLTNMAGDLWTLKTAQCTNIIARNPLDDGKLLEIRR
jgi:hypothetical protein